MEPTPPRTSNPPQRRRGAPKRRPTVWRQPNPQGTPATPPGTSGAEGVARERTEAKARSKRADRKREGHGEDQAAREAYEEEELHRDPW